MISLTKKQLYQHQVTRTKPLTIQSLKEIGLDITDSMYTSNGELVLVTSEQNQPAVYKDLAPEQRKEVIVYLQKNYNNVSQYKTIGNSRGRFLTMLAQPIDLSEPKLMEVKLPC